MTKCNGTKLLPHNSISLTFWTIFFTKNIRYPFNIFPVIGIWGTKYLKYKRYWQWYSHQRLRQTRWIWLSYHSFPLVEWRCSETPIVHYLYFAVGSICQMLYLHFWFSFLKSSNLFKIIDTGLQITQALGNVWEVFQVILGTFVLYRFKNMFQKE